MSLKGKFKSSAALIRDGVWFDLAENSDGSLCRFRLRRSGRSNKTWLSKFRDMSKDIDLDAMTMEEDEEFTALVFIAACIAEWENFQPEDDGNNIPVPEDKEGILEAVREILLDPDWNDLLKELQSKAASLAPFQDKAEKEAKN